MNKERKIHISTLLDDLKKVILVIILVSGSIGMLGDILLHKTQHRVYTTEALLSVAARKGDTRYAMYTNLNVTQQMAKTFSHIMNSEIIEQIVQKDLGIDQLNGTIEMSVTDNTNMMTLRVHGDSPQEAFEIMNSILNHYQDLCDQVMPGAYVELLQVPKVPLTTSNHLSHIRNVNALALLTFVILCSIVGYLSYLRDTIKSSSEVEEKLDAPLYVTVPYQKKPRKEKNKSILVTDVKTSFSYTEVFKRLRVKVENSSAKVIMVTSTLENEGKTTVSTNLAITLAKNKKRVLLMDLDLRNPSVAKMFKYKVHHEILDYLEDDAPINETLMVDKRFNLVYMLGKRTTNDAPELISSKKMEKLIQILRNNFDYIIIDTVPSRYLIDALATADYCDAILMVVKQNYATSMMINDTLDALKQSEKPILGIVFNESVKETIENMSHYSYYGHYYGYKNYGYGGYGKNDREKN